MNIPGWTMIGPLCYQGKDGCEAPLCTRWYGPDRDGLTYGQCMGWHCSYCDQPCSSQGHRCDPAEAILGEARRIAEESP